MKRATPVEILVAGAGPAGLSVAVEAAELGLSVEVVAPDFDRPWTPTYGAFADEFETLGLSRFVANRWDVPLVWTGSQPRTMDRSYARLHNPSLHDAWTRRAKAAGVRFTRDLVDVQAVEHARVVVDATGASAGWVGAAQVAVGRVVELAKVPWAEGEMVWMDFRTPDPEERPTFLYALPLGGNRVLLEETSLASAPPMTFNELERRLDRRIATLGLQVDRVVETERVLIPLDGAIPAARGAVVPFGAAASFVHPSTGYSIVRSLRTAPMFARALAEGLETDGRTAAARAHAVAWPTRLKASRALHAGGLRVLLTLDAGHTRRFFDTFFDLSPDLQSAWLDPTADPRRVATSMAVLFGQTSWGVRGDIFFAATLGGLA